jgi:DNA-directed RNA polymerase subunit M/transcription elongation factor TFIIS
MKIKKNDKYKESIRYRYKMDERELCVTKLKEIFDDDALCHRIENSIYAYTVSRAVEKEIEQSMTVNRFKRIYVNKLYSIYLNLKKDSYIENDELRDKIKQEEINIDEIAFLKPVELNEGHWKLYTSRQSAKEEFLSSNITGIKTKDYKCKKCLMNNCTFYQLQVRSSDEPMTTFVNCLNCHHKWSFN